MKKRVNKTSDAIEILRRKIISQHPNSENIIERESVNAHIAYKVHELRKRAKLTQTDLAKMVGTTTSAISRLEDSNYTGHSLSMLQKIATALNARIEVNFVALKKKAA